MYVCVYVCMYVCTHMHGLNRQTLVEFILFFGDEDVRKSIVVNKP